MAEQNLDFVSRLTAEQLAISRFRARCFCPDDGKYAEETEPMRDYLTSEAEWRACAKVQLILLETRKEFGQATAAQVEEVREALKFINPVNMALLEKKVTHHDQLAVIEELGRFISPGTKALLHPGTTSYDILDTARAYLMKTGWNKEMRPKVGGTILSLCDIAEETIDVLRVGRTHLQDTTPVLFGGSLAGYAARLAERTHVCDRAFNDLRGKVSGIVGTGASVDAVIGDGRSLEFEQRVLEKLDLRADLTATQIVMKERLVDVGNGIVSLMKVLGDFANDMRHSYSSSIKEVGDRKSAARLAGSSADAGKDNPINWENIWGKAPVVESGMVVLYAMIQSDFERDLRGSIQARYQPGLMMAQTYESFNRASNGLKTLSLNEDRLAENLIPVRKYPSEAMVAILRGEGWVHPQYGVGHDFVTTMTKEAKGKGVKLLDACLCDNEFTQLFQSLPERKQDILRGDLEKYTGSAKERAQTNIAYARNTVQDQINV